MALTSGQRKALEIAGDKVVSAKLKTVDAAPSVVVPFPGAHITRQDVESWLAERRVVNRPYQSLGLGIRRTIYQWAATAKGLLRAG
jgi:hypothetical protein